MKTLIVANWKLNPLTQKEAKALFEGAKKASKGNLAEIVVCPPLVYLPILKGLTLGAQNVSLEQKGAFTGEVSAQQLKDLGVEYVLVGHSERRKYFNETDEIIHKKIKRVLDAKLQPILCVGENSGEDKLVVIEGQITKALQGVSRDQVKHITVAYEPVWAIGTGKNCSVDALMESVLLIRKIISNMYTRDLADTMKILYGGSVTSASSGDYLKNAGVNGLLVGGASLDSKEFASIVKSAK